VEADGSLRRGGGARSWLKSFNRDSAKQDEGVFRYKEINSRSVREGISLVSMSKSEFSSRWRRVLYLSARTNWLDSMDVLLFGRTKQLKMTKTHLKPSPALRHSHSSSVQPLQVDYLLATLVDLQSPLR
jgi:hypothetical protein